MRSCATIRFVTRASPICNVPRVVDGATPVLVIESSTAVVPRVSNKNVRRLPSATTGTYTTPSWMSIGIVDVSLGANHSASGIVGVGAGACGTIGGVVTLMPAASRGGTGEGGGDINGDGNTCGDGVTLGLGAGVATLADTDAFGAADADAVAPGATDTVGEAKTGDADAPGWTVEAGDAAAEAETVGDADGGGNGVVVATGAGCGVALGEGAGLGCGIARGTTTAPAFAALAQRKMMPAHNALRRFTRRAFASRHAAALLHVGLSSERLVGPNCDASELA